ncbi:MAG: hypothetical protein CVT88_08100 [Candidatus Altiarchaeales archaeon HGW-Altiarchaeales-1]|nr:MAG: hypothetical protein CVT88_08100 [Candidatus Altiarchaeales archaeon HGW-Altiarchaeales-1]
MDALNLATAIGDGANVFVTMDNDLVDKKLKNINDGSRGADKIKISNSNGDPINIVKYDETFSLTPTQRDNTIAFLNILEDLTGWKFIKDKWLFDNFLVYRFKKGNIKPGDQRFNELVLKNPHSWAMTSTLAIEYTLEEPDKLP